MVLGESFEGLGPKSEPSLTVADGALPIGKTVSLAPLSQPTTLLRHCSFQAFVATCPCDQDMDFTVVKALNGAAGSVSLQSTNFPALFVAATPNGAAGSEKNRVTVANGAANKAAASWAVEKGLSDPSKLSFKSTGGYLTSNTKATGGCAGGQKGDVLVVPAPATKAAATWEVHSHPPPPPRPPPPPPPRSPWGGFSSGSAVGSASIVSTESFHGKDSLSVSMSSGSGIVGMSNRGLGHEGLVFEANKPYEGYFFAKSSKPVTFSVSMVDYVTGNKTLASQEIKFAGGNWSMLNFSLTPSAATACVGVDPTKPDPDVDCGKMVSTTAVSLGPLSLSLLLRKS